MLLLVFSVLHSIIGLLGILSNSILLYLACHKTPKSIGTYSILIVVRAITDASACFFDIFSQSRPIPSGLTLGIASTGICKYISTWSCFIGYSLQLQFHTYSFHLLIICFIFRYYVLLERYPKAKQIFFLIFLAFFPSFFQTLFILIDNNKPEDVRLLVKLHHPEYSLKEVVINGHTDLRHFSSIFAYLLLLIPVLPGVFMIYILHRKIHLKLRNAILRPEVREKHLQLTFSLATQSILSGIYLISSFIFFLAQLKLVESPFLETCILFIPIIVPVLNPLIGISLIRPYRESVMRWMGLDPKEWIISKDSSVAPEVALSIFGSTNNSSRSFTSSSAFTITEQKNIMK